MPVVKSEKRPLRGTYAIFYAGWVFYVVDFLCKGKNIYLKDLNFGFKIGEIRKSVFKFLL